MKTYMFELLPDGSIGARYFFNMAHAPIQAVKPGSTLVEIPIMGEETQEEIDLLQKARTRPEEVKIEGGRVKVREKRG